LPLEESQKSGLLDTDVAAFDDAELGNAAAGPGDPAFGAEGMIPG
jgi:hypothetical protein